MKSPAFSLYVRDWMCSKTVSKLHSKPSSKGVSGYLYLLCSAWLEEPRATLPNDEIELAALARVSLSEFREFWPIIKDQFPLDKSTNRLFNERLMFESNKQSLRSKTGSKGGSKRVANLKAKGQAKGQAAPEDEIEDEIDTNTYTAHARAALHYLNEKSGRHFRENDSSLSFINARLKEKDVTIEGVKKMIDRQCQRWMGTSQEEYLRPETLFGKQKFDSYYAAKDLPIQNGNGNHTLKQGKLYAP